MKSVRVSRLLDERVALVPRVIAIDVFQLLVQRRQVVLLRLTVVVVAIESCSALA